MHLKKQAMENKKEEQSGESGTIDRTDQQLDISNNREPEEQQKKDLPSEEQTNGQNTEESAQKEDRLQPREEQAYKARVLVSALNVRDKGGLDGAVVSSLNAGDVVKVVGKTENGEWVEVELNSGQTGWVMKKYIEITP